MAVWTLELVGMPDWPPSPPLSGHPPERGLRPGLLDVDEPRPGRQVIPRPGQLHREGPLRQGGPVSQPPSANRRMSQWDRTPREARSGAGVGVRQGWPAGAGPPPRAVPLGRPGTARWLPGRTVLGAQA